MPPFCRPACYVPLALLHASLLLRVFGDVAGLYALRRWGGLLNAAAVVLYLGSVAFAVLAARRADSPPLVQG